MFKVVHNDGKELSSAVTGRNKYNHSMKIVYIPGEWIAPKIGKIFVFESCKDAEHFVAFYDRYGLEIWECEVENPEDVIFITYPDTDLINKYWTTKIELCNISEIKPAPAGTVLCDRIKLIKKVENDPSEVR